MQMPIVMPKLGLTMTEGLVTSWCVKQGDRMKVGDVILVVETEKVATDILAEGNGTIESILVQEGEVAPVGEVIARWSPATSVQPVPRMVDAREPTSSVEPSPEDSASQNPDLREPGQTARDLTPRTLSTPLARRLARDRGIDWRTVSGSGIRGRVRASDIGRADEGKPAARQQGGRRPMSAVEKTVARRLTEAKQTIPHFYLMSMADATDLLSLRATLNAEGSHGRVTVTHLLLVALARALTQEPEFNAVCADDDIQTFTTANIGLAVDTPRGLYAPVIPDVGSNPLSELIEKTTLLIQRTRAGLLGADDMAGSAITLSNVGAHRVDFLFPIINPGQSAILGVAGITPVFRPDANDAPVLRRELGLALSCDHRVHDGMKAARFLESIVSQIENPSGLLPG